MNHENCKHVPNAGTLKAMAEGEEIIKNKSARFTNVEDMIKSLKKDESYLQFQKDRFGERWTIVNKIFEDVE